MQLLLATTQMLLAAVNALKVQLNLIKRKYQQFLSI